MGVQTPNGFSLDNSGKRVVVDPAGRRLTDPRIAVDGARALRALRRCGTALSEWAQP